MQRNLHKLKLHLQYIEEHGQSFRLEASVVREIMNNSLDPDTLKEYNREFMEFRAKQKKKHIGVNPEITELNFTLYFDSFKLRSKRLKFLSNFIENALEYQLTFHRSAPRCTVCRHPVSLSELLPGSQIICDLCTAIFQAQALEGAEGAPTH